MHEDIGRAMILSARMRFSDLVQPPKTKVIDNIVVHTLAFAESPLTVNQLAQLIPLTDVDGIPAINMVDLQHSLKRLGERNHLTIDESASLPEYRLVDSMMKEVEKDHNLSEERIKRIIGKLFADQLKPAEHYREPFFDCLLKVFSVQGKAYVSSLVSGDYPSIPKQTLTYAIETIEDKYDETDTDLIYKKLCEFFITRNDTDFAHLSWNLAQNYYILKSLGLDTAGQWLTQEQFNEAVFYLDTNIIIRILEPESIYKNSFKILCNAFTQLEVKILVSQITLDELQRVVEKWHRDIPIGVTKNVPDWIVSRYHEQKRTQYAVTMENVTKEFVDPVSSLNRLYHVEVIEDTWFDENTTNNDIVEFAEKVKVRPPLGKGDTAALHDALMLKWIQKQSIEICPKIWFLTADSSLPRIKGVHRNLAVTMDALLQWISPITMLSDKNNGTLLFAGLLGDKLLRFESLVPLGILTIYKRITVETQAISDVDIEHAREYLGNKALGYDPSDPDERTELISGLGQLISSTFGDNLLRIEDLEKIVGDLKEENANLDQLVQQNKANVRGTMVLCVFVALQLIALHLACEFGDGQNLFQKIIDFLPYFAIGYALSVFIGRFVVDKELSKHLHKCIRLFIWRDNKPKE